MSERDIKEQPQIVAQQDAAQIVAEAWETSVGRAIQAHNTDKRITQQARELLNDVKRQPKVNNEPIILHPANSADAKPATPLVPNWLTGGFAAASVAIPIAPRISEPEPDKGLYEQFPSIPDTFQNELPDLPVETSNMGLRQQRAETAWNAAMTTKEVAEAMITNAKATFEDNSTPENQNQERSYFIPEEITLDVTDHRATALAALEIVNAFQPQNYPVEGELSVDFLADPTEPNKAVPVLYVGEYIFVSGENVGLRVYRITDNQEVMLGTDGDGNTILIVKGQNDIVLVNNSEQFALKADETISPTERQTIYFITPNTGVNSVNVRMEPSLNAQIIGLINAGSIRPATKDGDWFKVVLAELNREGEYLVGYTSNTVVHEVELQRNPATPEPNPQLVMLRTAGDESGGGENSTELAIAANEYIYQEGDQVFFDVENNPTQLIIERDNQRMVIQLDEAPVLRKNIENKTVTVTEPSIEQIENPPIGGTEYEITGIVLNKGIETISYEGYDSPILYFDIATRLPNQNPSSENLITTRVYLLGAFEGKILVNTGGKNLTEKDFNTIIEEIQTGDLVKLDIVENSDSTERENLIRSIAEDRLSSNMAPIFIYYYSNLSVNSITNMENQMNQNTIPTTLYGGMGVTYN